MESKRIKVIPKNPNPLFKKWLKEWVDEAEKKKKKISQTYQRALDSLNKYPLTLYSGHDCAILENFGPKICQMLDEQLERHLNERLDLNQYQCHKDKISEIQKKETLKVSDLIRSVEAACLTDNSFAQDALIDSGEEIEMEERSAQFDDSLTHEIEEEICFKEKEDNFQDVEIPVELLSSSAESSDDSLDKLIRKYDPKAVRKKRKPQSQEKFVEDQKETQIIEIISQSPPPLMTNSPISVFAKGESKLRKFKTFDGGKQHLAGPSFASSPISKFLDVEESFLSPMSPNSLKKYDNDEFDRLATKYDFMSPIPAASRKTSPIKLVKKASKTKLKTNEEIPVPATVRLATTQSIPEEDEDDIRYTSVDDINPHDYNVVLLIDIGETSG